MTRTPQQIGKSNRQRGAGWQEQCASYLRVHGYPNAEYVNRNGANDLAGTGDVAVECTLDGWDKIWIKLTQAHRDAKYRNLEHACVWKRYVPKTGSKEQKRVYPGAGGGAIIMLAAEFWPLMADLEAYQRAEMDYVDTWEKAFAAGFEAGAKGEALNSDTG